MGEEIQEKPQLAMKTHTFIGGIAIFLSLSLFIVIYYHLVQQNVSQQSKSVQGPIGLLVPDRHEGMQDMLHLIRKQNDTIARMTQLLEEATISTVPRTSQSTKTTPRDTGIVKGNMLHHYNLLISQREKEIEDKDKEIEHLKSKLSQHSTSLSASSPTQRTVTDVSNAGGRYSKQSGSQGDECEAKYGYQLVEEWRKSEETWCEGSDSSIKCYPYHQRHKKLDGRGPDMFCVGINVMLDFSKIEGSISGTGGRAKLTNYLKFGKGSVSSSCKKTSKWRSSLFMPHHAQQMSTFIEGDTHTSADKTENTPTYLLARDEDCENSFHSTADFTNMHLVSHILNMQDSSSQQVMLFDKHMDGPYTELISKVFAGGRDLIRPSNYSKKKVLFKKVVFHLESPAGLIFPKVARPGQLRCKGTWLFRSYTERVLRGFNLWNVPPPPIPHATMLIRNRTPSKNVGRVMANPEEVENVLREGSMMKYTVVDTAKLPFAKQLELVRSTNILIGVHGAGLMLILFAADEAVLLEIHPSYRQDRHFRHASRMIGHSYIPIRSRTRESCHGSSDNVQVPITEFRAALDGAVRLARQFDTGISECGLGCPGEILALDSALDRHYASVGMKKTGKINTRFPCA